MKGTTILVCPGDHIGYSQALYEIQLYKVQNTPHVHIFIFKYIYELLNNKYDHI